MPYASNAELPKSVRDALPSSAQSVFRNVVNNQLGEGLSESRAFASAWGALENQGWEKGDDGKWHKVEKSSLIFKVDSTSEDKNLVFGWASVIDKGNGEAIVDTQGDVIYEGELEKGAYRFVKTSRQAGEMHERIGVGTLVESMVFTKEKQKALGIPEGSMPVGWWIGFEVDPDVFSKIKDGTYKAFSIGGKGRRKEIGDE